jgi:hypothetical protein
MKLINAEKQSLEVFHEKKIVCIRDKGKTYKFPYYDITTIEATSANHYTSFVFDLEVEHAYDGDKRVISYLSIGVNELHNTVIFNAVYIRKLKKRNKPIFLKGEFTEENYLMHIRELAK